ncbi:hypothetical protein A5709_09995 [Mycobacterium sp. E1386]|uniref:hypothetical protein n=1 Tax=Mycobacterium sp. E1386 TaxID=1834126 RepID=UPI0007FB9568|nr:hypothetical protein [Mycobacterium sp. E1386]OBI24921.1 hypothetical protein A5709_09995 [Mycobacterium sp. E1386]
MSIPDMDAQGPFRMDPAAAVWSIVRDLVERQRSMAELQRKLTAIQAKHAGQSEEIIGLNDDLKNVSDLVALRDLWYSKGLPSMVAKLALVLEVRDTLGDSEVTIDDPTDAALWRNRYFVAVDDLTFSLPPDRRRSSQP